MIQEKLIRSSIYNYHTVYRPISVTVPKNMLIRADASPRDEIYRFIRTLVLVYLAKWKAWSYREEDMEELVSNCLMHCYFLLVWRVKHGRYRKDLSFYLNVRSCAMSTVASEYRSWLPKIKNKLSLVNIEKSVVGTESLRLIDTLSERPQWKTPGETKEICNGRRYRDLPDKVTQKNAQTLRRYIDADYNAYLDDCEEFHVTSILSLDDYIKSNYTDEEYQIYKTNTDTVEYRRERRRKQREAAKKSNYAHYDLHKERAREAMRRYRERKKTAS